MKQALIPRDQVLQLLEAKMGGAPDWKARYREALAKARVIDKPKFRADEVEAISRALAEMAMRRLDAGLAALERLENDAETPG